MKKYEKVILSVKNNWKAIMFSTVYVLCFFITMGLSFEIIDIVKGGDFDLVSVVLVCVALFSLLSLIAKQILYLVFKEEAISVANKSSMALIPVGILMAIYTSVSIYSQIGPLPINPRSELEKFYSYICSSSIYFFNNSYGIIIFSSKFYCLCIIKTCNKEYKVSNPMC